MTQPFDYAVLDRAAAHAHAWLDGLDTRPVAARATPEQLRAMLSFPLPDKGADPIAVIDDLAAAGEIGTNGSASGRFYGWVIGGATPAALAADWLATAYDQNAGMFATGPTANIVEEVAGGWMKELLGLPAEAAFALVTGCQMAHATCLAAARNALLARVGWDVEAEGLSGAPAIRIVTSDQRHSSVVRAARFIGLGSNSIQMLPTGDDARLSPDLLEAALAAQSGPTVVLLQAADLNVGAFDDFRTLIPLAKAAGAWVHVDGAFGLWCGASPRKRHLLDGVERADSWATDAHKWLNVPYDSGVAFVADADALCAAMTQRASYLVDTDGVREAIDWNPEFSRRARGFAIYAALREMGRAGVADLVERTCDHARALAYGIGDLKGAERLCDPQANQAIVRFLDPAPDASDEDHDRRTDAVIAAVNASGEAMFTPVTWRGRRAMRISACNWRSNDQDAARVVAAVKDALQRV